jgi:hypothetical protein
MTEVRFYLRAVSYYRQDVRLVAALLGLIGGATLLGLLQA